MSLSHPLLPSTFPSTRSVNAQATAQVEIATTKEQKATAGEGGGDLDQKKEKEDDAIAIAADAAPPLSPAQPQPKEEQKEDHPSLLAFKESLNGILAALDEDDKLRGERAEPEVLAKAITYHHGDRPLRDDIFFRRVVNALTGEYMIERERGMTRVVVR